jgi:transglutaminase-like putative cysteine protease/predicted glutamine amidotransferase
MSEHDDRAVGPPPPTSAAAARRREHEATRLMAMSFDSAASPSITLRALAETKEHDAPYGWGFAWYPEPARAAMVVKDPSSIGENAMTKVLREWERFASTIFVCHLRGAARTLEEQDTHPFARSFGGRDWCFAHNGDLFGDLNAALPLDADGTFEPIGRTDSEHAFCWLLGRFRAAGARRLSDVPWTTLHGWLRALDALGTANFLLTDGTDLVAYHDDERYNGLYLARLLPPHEPRLEADDLVVDLFDAGDRSRTIALVSTQPFHGASWAPMEGGQMVVIRRGAYVFDSHADATRPARFVTPVTRAPRARALTPARLGSWAPTPPTPPTTTPSRLALMDPPPFVSRLGTRVLSVAHESVYFYNAPVERSVHRLRLAPVHDPRQELIAHELYVTPHDLRRDDEDVFGNASTHVEVETPYTVLRILSRAVVRVHAVDEDALRSPARRTVLPLAWMPWQRQMMLPYLLPMELPETQLDELYEYAMSFVHRQDHDLVQSLLDMNTTIFRDFRYISGATTLNTTPFDVYVNRRGVCQDFANLFICLARLLSVPARYRVGYIHTGADYANTAQGEASHAWVELYLPGRGWVGFDPTNGCLAGADHVRVACGRNYRDATPTSGTIYKGGGPEVLRVDVRVERLD